MKQYARFTTEQAQTIWAAVKKFNGGPTKSPVRNGHNTTYQLRVFNASNEAVPPFGCIQITGSKSFGNLVYLEGDKPSSTHGNFVINGPAEIAQGEIGTLLVGESTRFLSQDVDQLDDPFPGGVGYGPRADAWYLERGGSLVTGWGVDTTTQYKDIIQGILNQTETMVLKTTVTGIPAATSSGGSNSPGVAECVPYVIELNPSDEEVLTEVLTNAGQSQTLSVVNLSSEAISGDTYINAAVIDGFLTALSSAGGGGGGGQHVLQFKTVSAISAGNPVDGTSGDGSANLWTFNGTSWSIDNTGLYDIVNPWGYAVASDIMITAYADLQYPDKYVLIQAECEETEGGGDDGPPDTDPLGYCLDNATGAVTENVLQSECTGTWSADSYVMGCCNIGGTEYPDVAQGWCSAAGGSFTEGACPPSYNPCNDNAKFTVSAFYLTDPTTNSCASTLWTATVGNALGLAYQTGCTKRFYHSALIASSENPAAGMGVLDGSATYRAATNDWLITGEVRYFNNNESETWSVPFTGVAPNAGTDCASTLITANINGTGDGFYYQNCDDTDGTVLEGLITLQMGCN